MNRSVVAEPETSQNCICSGKYHHLVGKRLTILNMLWGILDILLKENSIHILLSGSTVQSILQKWVTSKGKDLTGK